MQEIYRFITSLGIEIIFIKLCLLKFLSLNKGWSTKAGEELLSDLAIYLLSSCDIPLDFHDIILVVPLKYSMYYLAGINTK